MARTSSLPVICIGAIHCDTIAHGSEVYRAETSTPANLSAKPGGVATNIARTLARLDAEVTLLGAIGTDGVGTSLASQLVSEGIQLKVSQRQGYTTGQYIAFHNPDGTLAAATVDDKVLSEAPSDLFNPIWPELEPALSEGYWFLDANLPQNLMTEVVSHAPKDRLIANAVSNAKAPRLKPFLPEIGCLMLNRGEALALTGARPDTAGENLVALLQKLGSQCLVLTSGKNDILALENGEVLRIPTPKARIVDVTGAGDALCAGMIAALSRGYDFKHAITIGLKASALTLESTGAVSKDMSWSALSKDARQN